MANNEKYYKILKKYWGFEEFRPLQLDIISAVGNGESALGLMPTGGGKSLTFQVPAMAQEGICIVISPLIALMKDQVANLKAKGIKAEAIYSGMTRQQILDTLENCQYGDFKFLYLSPERLQTDLFLKRVKFLNINMIAVDEAHCISQWGYDFRPSYLKIADLLDILPKNIPVLALTATATPIVVEDIQQQLKFKQKKVFAKSFERKNLNHIIRYTESKLKYILRILNSVKGSSIIYVRSRKQTKIISDFLNKNRISADYFHAGLSNEERNIKQQKWKINDIRVMVSTNAFGMGIDKPDVRSVIHFDLPDSIEAYFQEVGRAGRDEKTAFAVLLYNNTDISKLKKRISDYFPKKEFIVSVYQSLANYFTIAVGFGYEMTLPFSLSDFCMKYKLPQYQTYSALKIIELSGYIELTEETNNPSTLLFTTDRESLYKFRLDNENLDSLIEVLLRSYTGLFTDDTHINEELIAERLNSDRQTVYNNLVKLNKLGIIKYRPLKKTPLLIYTQNRVDNQDLVIPKIAYEERKKRYEQQINAMIDYVQTKDICLNKKLLKYFGQSMNNDCGYCSVCRQKNEEERQEKLIPKIEKAILEILQDNPQNIEFLTENIRTKPNNITKAVRNLLDRGIIYQNSILKLQIKD